MAYPFAACTDWLVGCSRHPVSSLLAQWLGFRFTVLCVSVCVVHNTNCVLLFAARCWLISVPVVVRDTCLSMLPHVSLHGFQNRQKPICRLLVWLCRTNLYGFFVHHLVFFFPFSLLFQGHLCCCSESISVLFSSTGGQQRRCQWIPLGSWLLYPLHPSPMLWGRRAWLQIKIARCMPWCFLLASVWSNVAYPVSTTYLLLTRMRHEKEVQHGWYEYAVNHDWRAVQQPFVNMFVWMDATHQQIGTTNHKVLFFCAGGDR